MKIYKYLTLIIVFATLAGCESYLDKEPLDFVSPEGYYKNEVAIITGVNGVYDMLQDYYYGRNMQIMADAPTDQVRADSNADRIEMDRLSWGSEAGVINDVWTRAYICINRANDVLRYLDAVEFADSQEKNRVEGELKFLRALNYFNLVRFFGGVPIATEESTEPQGRSTIEEVYTFIKSDLEFAENNLPASYSGSDVGRATKGAAKGLLAKVYLTREDWTVAVTKANEVMGLGYELLDDYAYLFDVDTKNTSEHIFSVQFGFDSGEGQSLSPLFGMSSYDGHGWSSLTSEEDFYQSWWQRYGTKDKRFNVSFLREFVDKDGVLRTYETDKNFYAARNMPIVGKYINTRYKVAWNGHPNNFPVLRYADVLLMHLEAANEAGGPSAEAVLGINQVRERAGIPLLDYTQLNQTQLRDSIRQERIFELCFEAHSYFDYTRWGILAERLRSGIVIDDENKRNLMPIPLVELESNPLLDPDVDQNPGY